MSSNRLMDALKKFKLGDIKLEDLSDIIEDMLFSLRQSPELSPDQELLSELELFIHEAYEGYRSWDELYELVSSIIEREVSEYFVKTITIQTPVFQNMAVETKATPVRDYRPDLSPV